MPNPPPIPPMLFITGKEPFNSKEWLYEIKYDGYRIQAHINSKQVTLYSRNLKNFTSEFPSIVTGLSSIPYDVVLDGEVIALDAKGKESWDMLRTKSKGKVVYMAFDILYLNGHSLTELNFEQRRSLLEKIIPESEIIKPTEVFENGVELFERTKKEELEGIVAKRKDSEYTPGKRSNYWIKIPNIFTEEFVVGGWAEGTGRMLASLLIGYYKGKDLIYAGSIGSGYKDKDLLELNKKLSDLATEKCPFKDIPEVDGIPHWVKPSLVVTAKYKTWTNKGKLRRPVIYAGLRSDLKPKDIKPNLHR